MGIYINDEELNKFIKPKKKPKMNYNLDIVYEDDNIIIINKEAGVLTHGVNEKTIIKNLVDYIVNYLILKMSIYHEHLKHLGRQ